MKIGLKSILRKLIPGIKQLKSMRFRIFLIIVIVSYIPAILLRYGILQNYEKRAVSLRTAELENQVMILADHLANNNFLTDPASETVNAELLQISNLYDGRIIVIDGYNNIVKDTYGISEGKTIISREVMECFQGKNTSSYDKENSFIELTKPILVSASPEDEMFEEEEGTAEEKNKITGVVLISSSTDNINANIEELGNRASMMQTLIALFVIVFAYLSSGLLVRPLNRVTAAIGDVKDGFTTDAIEVSDYLETEHIITAFNELMGRMRIIDESRQEFVSNVSHELKTPITSIKVLADSLNSQEDVPVELYREFMVDIADEIERENKIINDLLSLVRMDKTSADMNIESVDINALLERILKRIRPIAAQKDIEVIFESVREVKAEVDEVKLTLAFSNLVENGVKYNREHGFVKVTLDSDHQFFTVTVEDNGIGIPDAETDHIFERFYRVDKSHSREIGGTGLGLAIARSAIIMHRGAIRVDSVEEKGTTFTVKIPLTYVYQ